MVVGGGTFANDKKMLIFLFVLKKGDYFGFLKYFIRYCFISSPSDFFESEGNVILLSQRVASSWSSRVQLPEWRSRAE
jgi:hypothetical protein